MTLAQRAMERNVTVNHLQPISRFRMSALSAGLFIACAGLILDLAHPAQAALVDGAKGPQLLIGLDDDRQDNAAIQAGAVANQSLNRADVLEGGPDNDVMFGLNGDDVMDGGPGRDIILGGPDGGGLPNSDIMFGGPGDDVNLWAPGDGSETFVGGPGLDAIIFGSTDREAVADPATGVRLPTLRFGIPGFPQGTPHSGREWSGKLLHARDQPFAGLRLSQAVSRSCHRQHHRNGTAPGS
jgi:RTX calcium-binding nonapeptide repeat (4 copies)